MYNVIYIYIYIYIYLYIQIARSRGLAYIVPPISVHLGLGTSSERPRKRVPQKAGHGVPQGYPGHPQWRQKGAQTGPLSGYGATTKTALPYTREHDFHVFGDSDFVHFCFFLRNLSQGHQRHPHRGLTSKNGFQNGIPFLTRLPFEPPL